MKRRRRSSGTSRDWHGGVTLTNAALAMFAALWIASSQASAQEAPRLLSEARLDAITGGDWAVHAGAVLTAPLGTYVRFGIVAGVGPGAGGMSGRTDLIARFTLDPFRDKRWAPYAAGGVSAQYGPSRTYMVLMAGVEGPATGRFAPAFEIGFGGGLRAGVVLRQAFPRRR